MNIARHDWLRERATRLESFQPEVPLSLHEHAAIERIVGDAQVIAIGEMTHGSKAIVQIRDRLLRSLITTRAVRIIVLEACVASTRALNKFVISGEGTAAESLASTGLWSYANSETLHFVEWLRGRNAAREGRHQPVSVHGCDIQSIDGPKAELTRLLGEFGHTGQLASDDCLEMISALGGLPSDRDLYRRLDLLMAEADSKNPDRAKIAEIQAWRLDYMMGVRASVGPLTRRLYDIHETLAPDVPKDGRFYFGRCIRLLEQVVDFHFPNGFAVRDRYMAENVLALKRHFAKDTLALLVHNLHVCRETLLIRGETFVPMGWHLAGELTRNYKVIGTAFHSGGILAAAGDKDGMADIAVAYTPRSNSFESYLHQFAEAERTPDFLVDFSPRTADEVHSPWPEDLEMRIGETGNQGEYGDSFMRQRPLSQYDGLIYFSETTPVSILPEYFAHALRQWGST